MDNKRIAGGILAGVVAAAIVLIISLFLIKVFWSWIVPDLFPGAVEQGLIAESVSWLTTLKLAIVCAVISGAGAGHAEHRSHGRRRREDRPDSQGDN